MKSHFLCPFPRSVRSGLNIAERSIPSLALFSSCTKILPLDPRGGEVTPPLIIPLDVQNNN